MKEIAVRAGVSKTAVSLALRNDTQVSESLRAKIQAIAAEVGYVRNPKIGELMSQMRSASTRNKHGTLALFNGNQDQRAPHSHPTIPTYYEGCKRRAEGLGYAIDKFWLYEPGMSAQRWVSILKSRGISGIVIIGMMRQNRIPDFFKPVVREFPTTVTGVRTRKPALSFSCADHHMLTLQAFERSISCGYQRPGLVMESIIDNLVEHRFTSAYLVAQQRYLEPAQRLTPFTRYDDAKQNSDLFFKWFEREKPDVILTLFHTVEKWLLGRGVKIPEEVGLIQLEHRSQHSHWAGMDQHNDICGEAAVDLVINLIYNGEKGFPEYPRATLIGSTWVNGQTVRCHPSDTLPQARENLFQIDPA
jgi:LacI family transcriptional regulator